MSPRPVRPRGSLVDVFCGAAGLTHGFWLEGYAIAAGIDEDEGCRYAFEHNNQAPFIRKDVATLAPADLDALFYRGEPKILVGCAPCQPFSRYNQGNSDPKWQLVERFAELICATLPDVVSMENVPKLLDFQHGEVFERFVGALRTSGYRVWHQTVFAPDYGLPQSRSRLVLLASRHGSIELDEPKVPPDKYATVTDAIGSLPALGPGGVDERDPLHRAARLSERNLERIRSSKPGGTWRDWRSDLVADCHRIETGRGYASVYGRMRGDEPAPTITTQFFGFGNGRFGHPTQDRALSLREGALLQSFPADYVFLPPGKEIEFRRLGRMIGNAVPVLLGQAIARTIKRHIVDCGL